MEPPLDLLRRLTLLDLLSGHVRIEDLELTSRWVDFVAGCAHEGIACEVEASDHLLLHLSGLCLEWRFGPSDAPDAWLGIDRLCVGERCFALPPSPRSTEPATRDALDRVGSAIAWSSAGAWESQVHGAILQLRPFVANRSCTAREAVHRICTAADGWTVRQGRRAEMQWIVWRALTRVP